MSISKSKHNQKSKLSDTSYKVVRYRLIRYKKVKNHKKIVPVFVIVAPVSILIVIAILGQFIGSENISKDDEVKDDDDDYQSDYIYKTIDGQTIKLADHQGEVVILFFFYHPCPHCGPEADIISNIDDYYPNSQVFIVLITIDSSDTNEDLNQFKSDHNLDRAIVRDDITQSYSTPFEISGAPTTVILDQDGSIEEKLIGNDPSHESEIRDIIDSLL